MQRSVLFLATNMAIVLVLSLTLHLLGIEPYLTANGLNLVSLLIFAAVMGFGGSLIFAGRADRRATCRAMNADTGFARNPKPHGKSK